MVKFNLLLGVFLGVVASYFVTAFIAIPHSQTAPVVSRAELGIGGSAPTPFPTETQNDRADSVTSAETLLSKGNFGILLDSMAASGMIDKISGPDSYTLFAPSDFAFSKVPQDALYGLLSDRAALRTVIEHHMVLGSLSKEDLVKAKTIKTLDGTEIKVGSSNGISVNGIKTVDEIKTANGEVYIINDVLIPPDFLFKAARNI